MPLRLRVILAERGRGASLPFFRRVFRSEFDYISPAWTRYQASDYTMATATDSIQSAVQAYQEKLSNVQPRALAISVGTMTAATVGSGVLYSSSCTGADPACTQLAVSLLVTILRSMGSNAKVYSARLYYTTDESSIPWEPSSK
jgi:hypothetical protein